MKSNNSQQHCLSIIRSTSGVKITFRNCLCQPVLAADSSSVDDEPWHRQDHRMICCQLLTQCSPGDPVCCPYNHQINVLLTPFYKTNIMSFWHSTPWAIKTCHFTFVYIFGNYWPIFKIFSLAHSADNLQ